MTPTLGTACALPLAHAGACVEPASKSKFTLRVQALRGTQTIHRAAPGSSAHFFRTLCRQTAELTGRVVGPDAEGPACQTCTATARVRRATEPR